MLVFLSSLIFFDDFAFLHKAVAAERVFEETLAYRTDVSLNHWGHICGFRILAGEGGDFGIGPISSFLGFTNFLTI